MKVAKLIFNPVPLRQSAYRGHIIQGVDIALVLSDKHRADLL